MSLLSAPTYQDYQNFYKGQYGNASEGGGGGSLSEAQWNALGPAGQWNQIGGGMALGSDDPRWADMAQQLGIKATSGPDATVMMYGGKKPDQLNGLVDSSKVLTGDGSYAFAHSNFTPQAEFSGGGLSDKEWGLLAASLIGGGAWAGGAFGGDAAGAAADGASGSLVGNAGMPGYAGAFDSTGFAGTSLDPALAGGAAAGGAAGGAPVTDLGVPAQTGAPVVDHSVSAAGNGLFGNSGGLLGQAGNWIAANPLRAAGLAQTAYGLLGGHGSAGGSSSSSGGSKGGSGVSGPPMKVNGPQYYVNPYIAAQIQRGYGR